MSSDLLFLRKCTDVLYGHLKVAVFSNITVAILYVIFMLNIIPHAILFSWFIALVIFACVRLFLSYRYRKLPDDSIKTEWWYAAFIMTTLIAGSIWGSTFLLFSSENIVFTIVSILLPLGLASGAVTTLAISRLAAITFVISVLAPGIIVMSLADSDSSRTLAVTMFFYLCYLLMASLNTNRYLVKNLTLESENTGLEIENIELIQKLNAEKNRIEKFNEELEAQVKTRTAELEEINTRLRNSEEQFKSAFVNGPLGMALVDKRGVIMQVNPRSCDVLGFLPEELVGKSIKDITHPDDLDESLKVFSQLMSGEISSYQIDKRYQHKQGGYVWNRLNVSVVCDANDEILHGVVLIENITEQLRKEEQLIHAQKMEVMGQLTGGIAHDFNNLLTVVIGNLKFLKEETSHLISEEDQSLIDAALSAAWDGADLTQGLLAASRKQLLQPRNIEVNTVIDEFTAMIARTLGTNIEIDVSEYITAVYVSADPTQLKNALFNLAINARDAMPNGGNLKIDVQRKKSDDDPALEDLGQGTYVIISLTDDGEGMSGDEIESVFDPFFTTKEIGKGTGLGLSTVNGFTRQSGGKTLIKSTSGRGTTVSIVLPVLDIEAEMIPENMTESHSIEESFGRGSGTILVTEDETGVRQLAVKILQQLGYDVLEAENADAAIDIINTGKSIDLLFSDIMMPGSMDGRGLSDWVLKNHPDIKVLLTSGFIKENNTGVEATTSVEVLKKPYSKSQLASEIRSALNL